MGLTTLRTGASIQVGKPFGNLRLDVQVTNYKWQQRALSIVQQAIGLDEQAARTLLDATGGEVKTAILVAQSNISPDQARERLTAHGNILRAAMKALP